MEYTGPERRKQILDCREVAQYLQVHEMTVYRWLKKGVLPGFKLGGRWRTKKDILDKFLEERIK